jgi:hypothetical protein
MGNTPTGKEENRNRKTEGKGINGRRKETNKQTN